MNLLAMDFGEDSRVVVLHAWRDHGRLRVRVLAADTSPTPARLEELVDSLPDALELVRTFLSELTK